ncbi:uroporphyrinogen-III C-methyltransferase [Croceitalea vernalis]|uniref:uroporphyrinogen-III C-methyltransferase n=1 Tax=Croceitalea vernalis TaxID=3075599 RepID=A0ABU3BD20_9FLAO|nr:uroporphyrinogen-III C-methyltransferase [Croceitalea sp. P007]MDT0620359.1 uroporphyrinogen-III C-methyltransferase [Croceitalea sp. P007]
MRHSQIRPKVTLVGAGPGSKDLITVRGLNALKQANIVLYDALVSKELLTEIPASTPKIYVGKRCGKHSLAQEDINSLILEKAITYGHVVRLKGGDPFVFGRANEEIDFVESFGIPATVIPGISSAIAVPGGQGIPMTERGVSSSFWVMTATKRDGSFSQDLKYASQSACTMIILMGVRKILDIANEVSRYRGSSTPFAIIQNGSLPNESALIGTLGNVKHQILNLDTSKAGIIVIGDVVARHPSFFEEEVQRVICSQL